MYDFMLIVTVIMSITCRVPQGSMLGPLLLNVVYDEVLRLKVPDGVTLIMKTARKMVENLEIRTNRTIRKVCR